MEELEVEQQPKEEKQHQQQQDKTEPTTSAHDSDYIAEPSTSLRENSYVQHSQLLFDSKDNDNDAFDPRDYSKSP